MKVVDEQDGTPIAQLVALFWGTGREGTMTGQGDGCGAPRAFFEPYLRP